MKTITVEGNGWKVDIDIDDSNYDKFKDMLAEATAQALEMFFKNEIKPSDESDDEFGLGFVIVTYEKGNKFDPNKAVATLTHNALSNAGYHDLAKDAESKLKDMIKKNKQL